MTVTQIERRMVTQDEDGDLLVFLPHDWQRSEWVTVVRGHAPEGLVPAGDGTFLGLGACVPEAGYEWRGYDGTLWSRVLPPPLKYVQCRPISPPDHQPGPALDDAVDQAVDLVARALWSRDGFLTDDYPEKASTYRHGVRQALSRAVLVEDDPADVTISVLGADGVWRTKDDPADTDTETLPPGVERDGDGWVLRKGSYGPPGWIDARTALDVAEMAFVDDVPVRPAGKPRPCSVCGGYNGDCDACLPVPSAPVPTEGDDTTGHWVVRTTSWATFIEHNDGTRLQIMGSRDGETSTDVADRVVALVRDAQPLPDVETVWNNLAFAKLRQGERPLTPRDVARVLAAIRQVDVGSAE